jgi:hypothetical protein
MVCERTNRRRKSYNYLMDKITLAGGENAKGDACINWIKI